MCSGCTLIHYTTDLFHCLWREGLHRLASGAAALAESSKNTAVGQRLLVFNM